MGMACSTSGEKRNAYWRENQKEEDHWEHQWIILKWIKR
jgi:hypothetical protein